MSETPMLLMDITIETRSGERLWGGAMYGEPAMLLSELADVVAMLRALRDAETADDESSRYGPEINAQGHVRE